MAYNDDITQYEIDELIDDVYCFLPAEIADTLSDNAIEAQLEKHDYNVKQTVAYFKKRNTKKTVIDNKSVKKSPSPRPQSKSPLPSKSPLLKSKSPTPTTPLPFSSVSPRSIPTVQHSNKIHKQVIGQVTKQQQTNPPPLTVVFCGHVDSGKSTTVGHLLQNMGIVSQNEINKNRKVCQTQGKKTFEYAWVMDVDEDERSRGITISVGSVGFTYDNKNVRILDAPGHTDFLMKTIDAMSEADVAVVVVDAVKHNLDCNYEGTFVDIVTTLSNSTVKSIIVAINKMDYLKWSKEKFNSIVAFAENVIKETGMDISVRYVPISGLTGENLTSSCPSAKWARDCLLDVIVKEDCKVRDITVPFRMIVTDSFKQGNGSVVSGIITAGVLAEKDNVAITPANDFAVVKKIKSENSANVTCAGAGEVVEITIDGTDRNLYKGYVFGSPASLPLCYKKFHARVNLCLGELIIRRGTLMTYYCATGFSPCVFARIYYCGVRDVKVRPKKLKGKVEAQVEIILQKALCVDNVSTYDNLGHFFLRCNGHTIGKGVITELKA